jgi:hypothetical protein
MSMKIFNYKFASYDDVFDTCRPPILCLFTIFYILLSSLCHYFCCILSLHGGFFSFKIFFLFWEWWTWRFAVRIPRREN